MKIQKDVTGILSRTLSLGDQAVSFDANTPLLGSIPEFDSRAVVTVITAIEEHFGITVADDDINASTFSTVGSLVEFVATKLQE